MSCFVRQRSNKPKGREVLYNDGGRVAPKRKWCYRVSDCWNNGLIHQRNQCMLCSSGRAPHLVIERKWVWWLGLPQDIFYFQADDLLFCYRWLLLELKREFAFEDALHMLEVLWSSLDPQPPEESLSLSEVSKMVVVFIWDVIVAISKLQLWDKKWKGSKFHLMIIEICQSLILAILYILYNFWCLLFLYVDQHNRKN